MNTTMKDQAVAMLEQDLRQVPGIRSRCAEIPSFLVERHLIPDAALEVSLGRKSTLLLCEWKSSGHPRIVREAVAQLSWFLTIARSAYGVLLAPFISPEAAGICWENGIGYADIAGNCRLSFGGIYLQREGLPNPFKDNRPLRTLYSPKAERVLRVLLGAPNRCWKSRPLAGEAGVSLGQVSKVRSLLALREWIAEGPGGISIRDPESVLADWSVKYAPRRNESLECFGPGDVADLEHGLAKLCEKSGDSYALAGFSAAARLAPSVRYRRGSLYFSGSMGWLVEAAGLKAVDSGSNMTLLRPYDEGVYYGASVVDGSRIVSPLQAYLDLTGIGGRGTEAAGHLLDTRIRPAW